MAMLLKKSASGLQARPISRVAARRTATARRSAVVVQAAKDYPKDWFNFDATVAGASILGWTIPSSVGVSGFGGDSLFSLFMASIGENLAKFPQGPTLDDKFWLYLITWHVGLFAAMTLGQIGVQGRKQGYF